MIEFKFMLTYLTIIKNTVIIYKTTCIDQTCQQRDSILEFLRIYH